MTMQLATLNGKELMGEKEGTCVGQSCRGLFWISSLTSIKTPRVRARFEPGTSQTQNKRASPSPATLCLTKTAYHIISNTTTPVAYHSVYNSLSNRPHSTPTAVSYLRWLLSGATIDTALAQNVWSGPQHQDPVFISSRSKSWTTRTRKNLISVQRPQMSSAVNIRMVFIATEPACT
jgi:hypothetical protein